MNLSFHKYEAIWAVVQAIPAGKVATYGQIAELAGWPGCARLVGKALGKLSPDSAVPWHRVVRASGQTAPRGDGVAEAEQRMILRGEGVTVSDRGRIRLVDFRWRPD